MWRKIVNKKQHQPNEIAIERATRRVVVGVARGRRERGIGGEGEERDRTSECARDRGKGDLLDGIKDPLGDGGAVDDATEDVNQDALRPVAAPPVRLAKQSSISRSIG